MRKLGTSTRLWVVPALVGLLAVAARGGETNAAWATEAGGWLPLSGERAPVQTVAGATEANEAGARPPVLDTLAGRWLDGPPLPSPLTNNAVAGLVIRGRAYLFSFLGLDTTKRYSGIVRAAYRLDVSKGAWVSIAAVPGDHGRLAATAQGLGGRIYVFGGYTVDARGNEISVPDVNIYDPAVDRWSEGAPIPIPVDDAVSGVWRDSLIYLVSGWSQRDNVSNVQLYDPVADYWRQATPIPGPPVFGHAGGIVEDAIVYCDGVTVDRARRPPFRITDRCFRGEMDGADPTAIRWAALPAHPGVPKYRAAAGTLVDRGLLVFAGGTNNPYNYDGIGYDGEPSSPDAGTFVYDARTRRWILGPTNPVPGMDHRGLVAVGGELWSSGGMREDQRVTARVDRLLLEVSSGSSREPPVGDPLDPASRRGM